MTTKFNQEMYASLRAKKNEPLSSIGQKWPRVTKEVVETTASIPIASNPKEASIAVSLEEITPRPKRTRGSDKGKSKIDSNVWDDATTTIGRAHNVITPGELKGFECCSFPWASESSYSQACLGTFLPKHVHVTIFFVSWNDSHLVHS